MIIAAIRAHIATITNRPEHAMRGMCPAASGLISNDPMPARCDIPAVSRLCLGDKRGLCRTQTKCSHDSCLTVCASRHVSKRLDEAYGGTDISTITTKILSSCHILIPVQDMSLILVVAQAYLRLAGTSVSLPYEPDHRRSEHVGALTVPSKLE